MIKENNKYKLDFFKLAIVLMALVGSIIKYIIAAIIAFVFFPFVVCFFIGDWWERTKKRKSIIPENDRFIKEHNFAIGIIEYTVITVIFFGLFILWFALGILLISWIFPSGIYIA